MKRCVPVLCVLALGAGCARDQEAELPHACSAEPPAIASALEAAPAPVRVEGVAISECLAKDASVGDVQAVGAATVGAAQRLARAGDAVGLGYLVGALRRGGERSQGIHLEIVRRVEQEAQPFAGAPGYDRGLRAGRTSG